MSRRKFPPPAASTPAAAELHRLILTAQRLAGRMERFLEAHRRGACRCVFCRTVADGRSGGDPEMWTELQALRVVVTHLADAADNDRPWCAREYRANGLV